VCKVLGCLVAADRPAAAGIATPGRRQRDDRDSASNLGAQQSVRRWLGRVEQRVACPHVLHVLLAEMGMLERMCSLRLDLEGVLVVEDVRIEVLMTQHALVYYKRLRHGGPCSLLAILGTDACPAQLAGRQVRRRQLWRHAKLSWSSRTEAASCMVLPLLSMAHSVVENRGGAGQTTENLPP
jgi:hypothetical protein